MSWTVTERYEPVRHKAVKSLPCPGCGRKVRRQRTFTQTLSPFNRNADGLPCTRGEVIQKLSREAAEWEREPETCSKCA